MINERAVPISRPPVRMGLNNAETSSGDSLNEIRNIRGRTLSKGPESLDNPNMLENEGTLSYSSRTKASRVTHQLKNIKQIDESIKNSEVTSLSKPLMEEEDVMDSPGGRHARSPGFSPLISPKQQQQPPQNSQEPGYSKQRRRGNATSQSNQNNGQPMTEAEQNQQQLFAVIDNRDNDENPLGRVQVEDLKQFQDSFVHPANILRLNPNDDEKMKNEFTKLCDEVLSVFGCYQTAMIEMMNWKDLFLKMNVPASVKMSLTLTCSRLLRSKSDIQEPLFELIKQVRTYSQPWYDKRYVIAKLEEDYDKQTRALDIAIRKLEIMRQTIRGLKGQGALANWRRLISLLLLKRRTKLFGTMLWLIVKFGRPSYGIRELDAAATQAALKRRMSLNPLSRTRSNLPNQEDNRRTSTMGLRAGRPSVTGSMLGPRLMALPPVRQRSSMLEENSLPPVQQQAEVLTINAQEDPAPTNPELDLERALLLEQKLATNKAKFSDMTEKYVINAQRPLGIPYLSERTERFIVEPMPLIETIQNNCIKNEIAVRRNEQLANGENAWRTIRLHRSASMPCLPQIVSSSGTKSRLYRTNSFGAFPKLKPAIWHDPFRSLPYSYLQDKKGSMELVFDESDNEGKKQNEEKPNNALHFDPEKNNQFDQIDPNRTWFTLQEVMELTMLHAQQMQLFQNSFQKQIASLGQRINDSENQIDQLEQENQLLQDQLEFMTVQQITLIEQARQQAVKQVSQADKAINTDPYEPDKHHLSLPRRSSFSRRADNNPRESTNADSLKTDNIVVIDINAKATESLQVPQLLQQQTQQETQNESDMLRPQSRQSAVSSRRSSFRENAESLDNHDRSESPTMQPSTLSQSIATPANEHSPKPDVFEQQIHALKESLKNKKKRVVVKRKPFNSDKFTQSFLSRLERSAQDKLANREHLIERVMRDTQRSREANTVLDKSYQNGNVASPWSSKSLQAEFMPLPKTPTRRLVEGKPLSRRIYDQFRRTHPAPLQPHDPMARFTNLFEIASSLPQQDLGGNGHDNSTLRSDYESGGDDDEVRDDEDDDEQGYHDGDGSGSDSATDDLSDRSSANFPQENESGSD